MGLRNDIIKILHDYDPEGYEREGKELAERWINNRFHENEIIAWLEFGVTDPDEAYDRRANQENMPDYYYDDLEN